MTVVVNREYIFRFAQRPETEVQYRKEEWLLPRFADRTCLDVPMPLFLKLEPPPPLFVGYKVIPGTPLTAPDLQNDTEGYISQLGGFLRSLREFPLADMPAYFPVFNGNAWRNRYRQMFENVRAKLYGFLRTRVRRGLDSVFSEFLEDDGNFKFEPVLIHGDLSSDHILHDPEERKITGVIDWGDCACGDPSFDLAGIIADYGSPFASRLLETIEVDEAMFKRASFYARIIPLHLALYGINVGSEGHLRDGLRQIEAGFSRRTR